jgi:hypothetical protein
MPLAQGLAESLKASLAHTSCPGLRSAAFVLLAAGLKELIMRGCTPAFKAELLPRLKLPIVA